MVPVLLRPLLGRGVRVNWTLLGEADWDLRRLVRGRTVLVEQHELQVGGKGAILPVGDKERRLLLVRYQSWFGLLCHVVRSVGIAAHLPFNGLLFGQDVRPMCICLLFQSFLYQISLAIWVLIQMLAHEISLISGVVSVVDKH